MAKRTVPETSLEGISISSGSYRRIRDAIYKHSEPFRLQSSAQCAIFRLIRQKFGCRVTELRESEAAEAMQFVAGLGKVVDEFNRVQLNFEQQAIRCIFGAAGIAALKEDAEAALAELDGAAMLVADNHMRQTIEAIFEKYDSRPKLALIQGGKHD